MRAYRERSQLGWMALFAKVQQQGQSRRDTCQKHRQNRKPPRPAQPFAFKASEDKNHKRRYHDIGSEERADPIGEQLIDHQSQLQTVFLDPWPKPEIRDDHSDQE
jgi:hypothetical protein